MNETNQLVVFLHIPKAAGSTLGQIIRRQYAGKKIIDTYPARFRGIWLDSSNLGKAEHRYDYVKSLPAQELADAAVFMGHEGFGIHTLFPKTAVYLTMLRNPIDRVLSYYYYVLRNKENRMHKRVVSQNLSLDQFVSSGLSTEIDNSQTKFIAGLYTPYLREEEYSDEILDQAKQNIENHFAVVGLTERFNESLLLMKQALNWHMPYYVAANVTNNRPMMESISQETIDIIEQKNKLDIALYEYVSLRFEEMIERNGRSFSRELRLFNTLNKPYTVAHKSVIAVKSKMKAGS